MHVRNFVRCINKMQTKTSVMKNPTAEISLMHARLKGIFLQNMTLIFKRITPADGGGRGMNTSAIVYCLS